MVLGETPSCKPIALSDRPEATSARICSCRRVNRKAFVVVGSLTPSPPPKSLSSIPPSYRPQTGSQTVELTCVCHAHEGERTGAVVTLAQDVAVSGARFRHLGDRAPGPENVKGTPKYPIGGGVPALAAG